MTPNVLTKEIKCRLITRNPKDKHKTFLVLCGISTISFAKEHVQYSHTEVVTRRMAELWTL